MSTISPLHYPCHTEHKNRVFRPKNKQRHSAEAECRLFCCPILLGRCQFCSFLKLLSYQHTPEARFFAYRLMQGAASSNAQGFQNCHSEERSDVGISQYPAASWESDRQNRNCLPEIATGAKRPRNDKLVSLAPPNSRCKAYGLQGAQPP